MSSTMKAMTLHGVVELTSTAVPLSLRDVPLPVPEADEVLVKVSTCGVCHTELDEIEGRTPPPAYPVIPGHQVVGQVVETGRRVKHLQCGDRVGVAWIHSACMTCRFCATGRENLCSQFKATGRDVDGGYGEYMTVREDFAHAIPEQFTDAEAAPLLCAGAIGYRSLSLCNLRDGDTLGLSGFGASAHLVLKMAKMRYPRTKIIVLARNKQERSFALELGATWAGDFDETPPEKPHCIIDTTPAWRPVLSSLAILEKSGRLVINAIRKEDRDKAVLAGLDYPAHLWLEKEIKSVANVSRDDVKAFLRLAAEIPIKPEVEMYQLEDANKALFELKTKKIRGAKVLQVAS